MTSDQNPGACNTNLCVAFRCSDSPEAQLVLQRFQQVGDIVQDFMDNIRSNWSSQLDSDCGFILKHPLIQVTELGPLEVSCSLKVRQVRPHCR